MGQLQWNITSISLVTLGHVALLEHCLRRAFIFSPSRAVGSSPVLRGSVNGVIKQNQSEVGHIQFSVSYWIVTSICKATFCRKPH